MIRDHKVCDGLLSSAEQAVRAGDWPRLAADFAAFDRALERHIRIEEDILFPSFEERTGMTAGPTQVMRAEHRQMREVLLQLRSAVAARDANRYLGFAETLSLLVQQHNLKEESILYRAMDEALELDWQALFERMESAAH